MIVFWIVAVIIVLLGFTVFFGAPYVPSHRKDIVTAFDKLYTLKKTDVLLDMGAGDGVVLRYAAQKVKRAVGFELNPIILVVGKLLSRRHKNVDLQLANMWTTPFPKDTTVIYVFCNSRDLKKLERRVQSEANRLGRILYVVSYGFTFHDREIEKQTPLHFLYSFKPLHKK